MKAALMLLGLLTLMGCQPFGSTVRNTEPRPQSMGMHEEYVAMKSYPLKGQPNVVAEVPKGEDPFLSVQQSASFPQSTSDPVPSGPQSKPGVVRISSSGQSAPKAYPVQQVSAEEFQP